MSILKSRSSRGLAQILKAVTVVACVGLAASPALAQGGGGGGGGGGGRGGDRGGQPENGGGRRTFGGGGGGMGMFGGGMGGMGRFGAMNDPLMTSRDMPKYGQILQLTDDQQEAAKGLLEAYQLEVQTKRDEMQKAQEEMRESFRRAREEGGGGDPGAGFERMREAGAKFRAEKTKLDKTFMSDLKSLLTPEQEANWATFERVHRREKQMDRGLISGERADLVKLIEEAKLPAEAQTKVQPLLAQYEEELDRELVNREKVQEDLMNRMSGMQFGPDMDQEKMQRMVEEGRDAAKRVREVNRKYARQVQEQLPEDQQFAFAKAFKTASYPDVYRETYANTAIGSALGFADLGADQKQSVQAIRDSYARDVAVLNDKLAVAQEEMEENFSLQRMRDGGDRTQDGLRELRRQKRELDETTVESLRKVLTPEQQERLPQREQRGQGGGRGGEDGGQRRRGGDGQGGGRGDRM